MNKSLMGILSFAPIVLVGGSLFLMFPITYMAETSDGNFAFALAMIVLFVAVLIGVALTWVDIIWFIIIAFKKKNWSTDKKVIWAIILYCCNLLAFPVFWWMVISKDNS